LPPNRNERQIRPLSKNRGIVGSCVAAVKTMLLGSKRATARLVEPASIKTNCPVELSKPSLSECKLPVNSL
jgi:hypothetical protein